MCFISSSEDIFSIGREEAGMRGEISPSFSGVLFLTSSKGPVLYPGGGCAVLKGADMDLGRDLH